MDQYGSLVLLALPLLLLVLVFNGQRKRQRQLASVQQRLVPGTRIVTSSGLYATVVEVGDDTVVLEAAPGQQMTWMRQAVMRVVETHPSTAAGGVPAATSEGGASALPGTAQASPADPPEAPRDPGSPRT